MCNFYQERPYHNDSTASRLLSEVKHCRARLVLRWGTTLESLVLFFCICFYWSLTGINYFWVLDETEITQQSTKLKLRWGTTFQSLVLLFYICFADLSLTSIFECGMRDHLIFFTGNYWNYSKQSTKLKLDRGPRWNPWYCSFRFFCWSLAGTNIQVSDERWSLYFSQEITQQSNKLKRCGRLLLRRFVCGRVGVMVVCVVLFVCLLDGI